MTYLNWATCNNIISSKHLNVLDYFKIIINLNIGTCDNTSIAFDYDQNNCILVTCDNTYTMESKDEFVFVDVFFHSIPFVICY
jgi:hypothetical protein